MARVGSAAMFWGPTTNGGASTDKVAFSVPDVVEYQITDTRQAQQLVQPNNGPDGVLRILNGRSLTTGTNWSAAGYDRDVHYLDLILGNGKARLFCEPGLYLSSCRLIVYLRPGEFGFKKI